MQLGHTTPDNKKKTALWKAVITPLAAVLVFIGLLEAVLALFGVRPILRSEDPFVGFSSNIPLFVEKNDAAGRNVMATADNKLKFFNMQQFPREKAAGTYRIFCLGGSTTYGRPYDDKTSFAGWLRELLPVADSRHRWEVINAGGISYASYRVAHLMEELVRFEPDLFIVYTGHNEFLEERTYGAVRDLPGVVKTAASVLARTRTWAAMSTMLERAGAVPETQKRQRVQLTGEVSTILARSAGPERYGRDDPLRDNILEHYRISLERMTEIARAAGAKIIFVTPASNLKDSSPFKSQHTDGLGKTEQNHSEELLAEARKLIAQQDWNRALGILDEALALDPRYAELHYRRGKVLFAIGRYGEAAEAFRRARDEDVCPLRALTSMQSALAGVAEQEDVPLIDFVGIVQNRTLAEEGYAIPGREYFLDHVHPTIKGNRLLALELVKTMTGLGIVQQPDKLNDEAIDDVTARITGSINAEEHARALVNLARVLSWAGKYEDATRIAMEVMSQKEEAPDAYLAASAILATMYQIQGETDQALQNYRRALHADPDNPITHLQYGLTYLNEPLRDFERAAAHILFATVFGSENDMAYMTFGLAMAERQRYPLAYSSLMEAVRINPQNTEAQSALSRLQERIDPFERNPDPPKVSLDKYPSGAVSKMVQVRQDETGRYVPNGIWTEWYENGELKRFVDYAEGMPNGVEIIWNPDGEVFSRLEYRQGIRISEGVDSPL